MRGDKNPDKIFSSMKHSILCVDDEVDNVEALQRLFRKKYHVLTALSGEEGLEIIKREGEKISLIISDQRMPHMAGTEFFKKSIEYIPGAIRILLTGFTDIGSVISAINSGEVFRYVTKPWNPTELTITVDKAIERFELAHELKEKNKALETALEELKGLDRAKTHFMYLVNHELKTPLTVLSSFAGLLSETHLDEEQKKYVSQISSSCEKLQSIVEDVLQLSSAEIGLVSIRPQALPLRSTLSEITDKQINSAKKKFMTFKIPNEEINIQADPRVIKKVLFHIIDNAVKFGETSSIIECGIRSRGAMAEIYVCNSGKTLDPSLIEKILKPFTLDENIMNHSSGLGLGLSLCQALLKNHGSKLKIHSSYRKVEVSFQLPLEVSPEKI